MAGTPTFSITISYDGVVAISRIIAELLAKAGVSRRKIRLIPSGIDPLRFNLARFAQTPSFPLMIAAVLEERKGHAILLKAASLKSQGHKGQMSAGEGPFRQQLKSWCVIRIGGSGYLRLLAICRRFSPTSIYSSCRPCMKVSGSRFSKQWRRANQLLPAV